ncbi:MAG: hypothetical protein DYG94_09870 [Leptolyngbya sp. PLA3]|nr:MAG: hypothetical protein EDM82_05015 [Cyanobacteria bacterium CYA]MCE7969037.1 hypothetical protein [Leptolyngbya sp. PL-A3]
MFENQITPDPLDPSGSVSEPTVAPGYATPNSMTSSAEPSASSSGCGSPPGAMVSSAHRPPSASISSPHGSPSVIA